jgi:ADP-heptose:LPS heptosyltransferase
MKNKILVIRNQPLKFFAHSISAFAAIREYHKDDEITLLTTAELKDFAKSLGFFNKFIIDELPDWFMFGKLKRLITLLRTYGFTRVYDLQNSERTEWYFKLMGYRKPQWNSSRVSWCSHYYQIPKNQNFHFQEVLHNQLRQAGIVKMPNINISYLAKENLQNLPEKYCVICAGGNSENLAHKYNPENYAEIIKYLKREYDITSILVGNSRGDGVVNSYIQQFAREASPLNFYDKTDRFEDLIQLFTKAQFCLGNETAPTHLAAFSGLKTIMLCSRFSPSDFLAPRVKNLAVIEEDYLENVTIERIIDSIQDFALTKQKESAYKQM